MAKLSQLKFNAMVQLDQAKVARENMEKLATVKAMCSMPGKISQYDDEQLIELVTASFTLGINLKA